MAGGGALALGGDAALHEHERLARGEAAHGGEKAPAVADAFEVAERDGRLGIGAEVLEVIGQRRLRGVAAGDRLADADPGLHGVVEERRDQVPALARDRDPARRRVGRDDLRAHRARRRDHALPVRPGDQHAELVRHRHQLALERPALGAGLAVARARDEGRAHALARARAQQLHVGRVRRADEDEIGGAVRHLRDVAEALAAEHLGAVAIDRKDLARVAEAQQVVEHHEAELPGVRGRAGDDDAARVEERSEAREHRGIVCLRCEPSRAGRPRARSASPRCAPPCGLAGRCDRVRPSASTAIGRGAAHDQRIHVDAAHVRALGGEAAEAHEQRHQRRVVDGGLAAEGLEQEPARAQAAQHSGAPRTPRPAPRRRPRRRAPRRGCRRARASRRGRAADPAPGPRSARDCRAPSRPPAAAPRRPRGARGASRSCCRAAHRRVVGEAEAHQPALRLVGDAAPA